MSRKNRTCSPQAQPRAWAQAEGDTSATAALVSAPSPAARSSEAASTALGKVGARSAKREDDGLGQASTTPGTQFRVVVRQDRTQTEATPVRAEDFSGRHPSAAVEIRNAHRSRGTSQ
jgi:hypothetical protein